ncbi:MAG: indolepyruvate oxidoreductase subunit beta [Thermodesulfobacteriota bacterium]
MRPLNFILSGLGGQGILFMTKALAQTALRKGFPVICAETHGMSQRGGSVISHLRIGDVQSSLVRNGTGHFLISLDETEAYRNLRFLDRNSRIYVNAHERNFPNPESKPILEEMDIVSRSLPAGKIALEMKAPLTANLALLGFFSAYDDGPFTAPEIRETIHRLSPERFREINLNVFDACLQEGIQRHSN